MKKIILSAITFFTLASANNIDNNALKKAYNVGIYDTLSVLQKDVNLLNKTKRKIKGYAVFIDINNIPLTEIIRDEAFAIKIGLTPLLTDNYLIFDIKQRRADAEFTKKMITNNSNIKPKIKYLNKTINVQNIFTKYIDKSLPEKVLLVYVKEKPCKKITIKSPLHFINRILNTKAYNKYCKNTNCSPKINTTLKEINQTKNSVKKTIGKIKISFKGLNFFQISKILSKYGVITKDNRLIVGNKIYKTGDLINNKYKITYIDYNRGIVVIDIIAYKIRKEK